MTFTHCGKFGDMLMCLPILSAYYKRTGEKPDLVLAQFPYADSAVELLRLQECVGNIGRVDNKPTDVWGGWPYKPPHFKIDVGGDVAYLGFRGMPDKSFVDFVAEEHGFAVDHDFELKIGGVDFLYEGKYVCIERYDNPVLGPSGLRGEYIPREVPILEMLRQAAGAAVVSTYATGAAMALCLAGIRCKIYVKVEDYKTRREWVYNRFIDRGVCELVII